MISFSIVIVSIVFGILVGALTEVLKSSNKYCNSSYSRGKDSLDIRLDKPEYKVEKVERCYTKNTHDEICKYTVSNYYIAGKNKVGMQELCFYAEVGAYNAGDILTLENLAKYNDDVVIQKAVAYLTDHTELYEKDIVNFKNYMKGE